MPAKVRLVNGGTTKVRLLGVRGPQGIPGPTGPALPAEQMAALSTTFVEQSTQAPFLIKYGQDLPTTAAIGAAPADYKNGPFDGWVVLEGAIQPLTPGVTITKAEHRTEIDKLPADMGAVRQNWIRLHPEVGVDWFNDAEWTQMCANMTALGEAIVESGRPIVGIFLDPEWYGAAGQAANNGKNENLWYYGDITTPWTQSATLGSTPGKTPAEARAKVRARGKQLMDALTAGWPTVQVLSAYGPWASEQGTAKLLGSFVVGLAESTWTTDARLIDGGENYNLRTTQQFAAYKQFMKDDYPANGTNLYLTPATATDASDVATYQAHVTASFGVYDKDLLNSSTLIPSTYLGAILEIALTTADRYAWLYTETHEWAASGSGKPAVPSDYVSAVTRAKANAQAARRRGTNRTTRRTTDVQTFTADGTWRKPIGAKTVKVFMIGPGGGGGAGRRGAAGTVRCGGGGGAGGAVTEFEFDANALLATESVAVGTGGVGAAAVTADDTNGGTGGSGSTDCLFGAQAFAGAGSGGGGGTNAAGVAGSNATGRWTSGAGGAANAAGGAGTSGGATTGGAYGGGAGGGITTADVESAGGSGLPPLGRSSATTAGGTAAGGAGGDGTSAPVGQGQIGGPGSGGGSAKTVAAGAGGAGGRYGAGGGGGGASLNGFASGKGGDGAPGIVVVTTYF